MALGRIQGLPMRYPEIGRLRGGDTNEKGQPVSLDHWKATSQDDFPLKVLCSIYGGDVVEDAKFGWSAHLETRDIDVLLPVDSLFVAYESWGSGGCQRRCDGEACTVPVEDPEGGHLDQVPCICAENGWTPGVEKSACTVTVRLKVVIPNVPGMGVWMVTSSSLYAAMELPSQVELIEGATGRVPGMLIPCVLALEPRTEKKAWERFERRYNVPTLRIQNSIARLQEQIAQGMRRQSVAPASGLALPAPEPSALPPASAAPSGADVQEDGAADDGTGQGEPKRYGPPEGGRWTKAYLVEIYTENGLQPASGANMGDMMRDLQSRGLLVTE